MTWYLGVDAGGSYTRAVVLNPENGIYAEGHGGIGNPYAVDPAVAYDSIERAVANALGQVACHAFEVSAACIGVAGIARQGPPEEWKSAFSNWGMGRIDLVSDLEIAHFAGFQGGPGVHVIAGTGSSVLVKEPSGHSRVFGGWGWLTGDEGSAADIGRRATQWLCREMDLETASVELAQALLAYLKADQIAKIVPNIYHHPQPRQLFAGMAPIISRFAESDEPDAQAILHAASTSLASVVQSAVSAAQSLPDPIPLATSGGVFQSAFFAQSFFTSLQQGLGSLCRVQSLRSPLAGALQRCLDTESARWPTVRSVLEAL